MFKHLLAVAALAFLPITAFSQGASKDAPKKQAKALVSRDQIPADHEILVIEGFTFIFGKESWAHKDDPAYKKTPVQVLEQELKAIVATLSTKSVDILRRLPIWVEWNMNEIGEMGRLGRAVAIYEPATPEQAVRLGKHPLTAKTVTILRMKWLTEEHQPERDVGRCVILHEIAHAVHDQLLGFENEIVIAAYRQAIDRKLVDRSAYASTNEKEFFAEMTCAYFDQLDYLPRTRGELSKHDPVTYKLMENVWGKAKMPVVAKAAAAIVAPPLAKLQWGKSMSGPAVSLETAKGKPTLILYWNAEESGSLASLGKIDQLDASLRGYGFVSVAVHLITRNREDAKSAIRQRGLSMSVSEDDWFADGVVERFKDFPLCLIYDHEGRCVFKGSPAEAESAARSALGNWFIATADLADPPKALVPLVKELRAGKSPATLFGRLVAASKSKDEQTSTASKKLLDTMIAPGQTALDAVLADLETKPFASYLRLEQLTSDFKDTPVAAKATESMGKLKTTKAVAVELAARPGLADVKKLDAYLSSRPGAGEPNAPAFISENADSLRRLTTAVQQLRRNHPNTQATEQANRIASRYGIP